MHTTPRTINIKQVVASPHEEVLETFFLSWMVAIGFSYIHSYITLYFLVGRYS